MFLALVVAGASLVAVDGRASAEQSAAAGATAAAAGISATAAVRSTVTPGAHGFDTRGVETARQLSCLRSAGYSFDLVDVVGTAWRSELTSARAAGMKVVLFQGFDPSTWPHPTKGTERGTLVAQKARQAGYPAGAQIYLNFEQNTNASAATLRSWVGRWANAVSVRGYVPGVYVGVPQKLTAAQLSALPGISVFWRSASSSAPQLAKGYAVRQPAVSRGACRIVGGIDLDVAGTDAAGHHLIGQK